MQKPVQRYHLESRKRRRKCERHCAAEGIQAHGAETLWHWGALGHTVLKAKRPSAAKGHSALTTRRLSPASIKSNLMAMVPESSVKSTVSPFGMKETHKWCRALAGNSKQGASVPASSKSPHAGGLEVPESLGVCLLDGNWATGAIPCKGDIKTLVLSPHTLLPRLFLLSHFCHTLHHPKAP